MSFPQPRFHIAGFLKFTAVFGLFLALFHMSGFDGGFDQAWPASAVSLVYSMGMSLVCTCCILLRGTSRPRCQACGQSYVPISYVRTGGLCPRCRLPKLAPEVRRRVQMRALFILLILLLLFAFVVLWPFSRFLGGRHGWFAYPALALGLFVLSVVVYVGAMVLRALIRNWRMSSLGYALDIARSCAGEPGRKALLGSMSVYIFGRNDPMPMFEVEAETCRRRFESLVGGPIDAGRPLRIFAFGKRTALEGFCRRSVMDIGNADGVYVPWSARTLMLTSEFPAYRLGDPERVFRSLLSYYYLDMYRKCPSPLWIQSGVAGLIACGGDSDELARLNRRLMPALARGTVLGSAAFFQANPRTYVRYMKRWQQLGSFSSCQQLVFQSWSITEYLCGHEATNDQRERFRGFLTELKPNTPQAAVFERHFGQGFDALFERWRAWVLAHGIGTHRPPPERIRHALLGRVIPIVLDRDAHLLDRIQAIRDLGRTGYVLGADALIEVLRSGDENLSDEAAWSLEAISGLPLGQDANRWADEWLAGLPEEVTGLVKTAE